MASPASSALAPSDAARRLALSVSRWSSMSGTSFASLVSSRATKGDGAAGTATSATAAATATTPETAAATTTAPVTTAQATITTPATTAPEATPRETAPHDPASAVSMPVAPAPRRKTELTAKPEKDEHAAGGRDDIDKWSGLALVKRLSEKLTMEVELASAQAVKIPDLTAFVKRFGGGDGKAMPDWALGGVVSEKQAMATRVKRPVCSTNKDAYVRWKLADLAGNVVTALIFGEAHAAHLRVQEGDIVVLHNAALLKANERNQGVTLTVKKRGQVMLAGQARDYTRCRGTVAATGEPCKIALNKCDGVEYCVYHLSSALKRFSSSRMDLNSTIQPVAPKDSVLTKPTEHNMSSGTYTLKKRRTPEQIARENEAFEVRKAREEAANAAYMQAFLERNPNMRSHIPSHMKSILSDRKEGSPATPAATFDSATIRRIGYNPSTGILAKPSDDHSQPKLGRGFAAGTSIILAEDVSSKRKLATMIQSGVFLPAKSAPVPSQNEIRGREQKAAAVAAAAAAAGLAESTGVAGVRIPSADGAVDRDRDPEQENEPPAKRHRDPAELALGAPPTKRHHDGASLVPAASLSSLSPSPVATASPIRAPISVPSSAPAAALRRPPEAAAGAAGSDGEPKKRSLAELLGRTITADSAEGRKVLKSGGRLGDEAKQLLANEQASHFARLAKLEAMSTKLQGVMEITVKAVYCEECHLLLERALEPCRRAGHKLTPQSAKKHFFKCSKCGQRNDTLGLVPTDACVRCGAKDYTRTGMREDGKGPELHKLLPRGEEQPFALSSS